VLRRGAQRLVLADASCPVMHDLTRSGHNLS
jgi:hypothetical protein